MRPTLLASCAATALLFTIAGASAQGANPAPMSGKEGAAAPAARAPSAAPGGAMSEHRSAAQDVPKADVPKADAPKADAGKPMPADRADKPPANPQGAAADKPASGKTDRAASSKDKSAPDAKSPQTGRSAASDKKDSDPNTSRDMKGNTPGKAADKATDSKAAAAPLDADKQERLRSALTSTKAERITNVTFNVSVGTRVPPRYRFNPLPTEIVDIVPQYRGYDYIVVEDDIVIVNPRTREIVYTVREGRSAGMNRPSVDCR